MGNDIGKECDVEDGRISSQRLYEVREISGKFGINTETNTKTKFLDKIFIYGNKMPTRCNRLFLLQILLLAQHVSGTTMQQPANRTHNPQLHTTPTT